MGLFKKKSLEIKFGKKKVSPTFENFYHNTNVMVKRAVFIVNSKEKAEGKRYKLFNKVNGLMNKALDVPDPQPYIDKARSQIDELIKFTKTGVLTPVKLFCSIVENHAHISKDILRKSEKNEWFKEAYRNMKMYEDICIIIKEQIIPLYSKQVDLLEKVKINLSIVVLTEYEHEHRYEREEFRKIYDEVNIRMKKILRLKKRIRILSRQYAKAKDEHKAAFLAFEMSTTILGIVCGFTATYQGLNFALKLIMNPMNTMQSALGFMNMGSEIVEVTHS